MKTLKISELKEGEIYWCNLSDRKVLITSMIIYDIEDTGEPTGYKTVYKFTAIAYAGAAEYSPVEVYDNMLSLLPIKTVNPLEITER